MPQTRRILACDGGGIRGIITLRCLEKLEERVGPLHKYFDMFAGTSTGSMIAGSLAAGTPVAELIDTYTKQRRKIYTRRPLWFLHPLVTKYQKAPMHRFLSETFKEAKLSQLHTDILITAVDTVRSETTYFSSFRTLEREADGKTPKQYGTYRNVRLRDAIEASASAPTYFAAHGRFIDGGSTVYNNPAYVAAVEALRFSSDKPELSRYNNARLEVYSFSTGAFARTMEPYDAMQTSALGWIEYLIEESASQSGEQQSYVAQSELDTAEAAIVFYRYDLYLTPKVIMDWGPPGGIVAPDELTLDAVDELRFGLMDTLGQKYAAEIFPPHWDPPPEPPALPRSSAAAAMLGRTQAAGCWNQYGRPKFEGEKYVKAVLDQFDAIDRRFGASVRA